MIVWILFLYAALGAWILKQCQDTFDICLTANDWPHRSVKLFLGIICMMLFVGGYLITGMAIFGIRIT